MTPEEYDQKLPEIRKEYERLAKLYDGEAFAMKFAEWADKEKDSRGYSSGNISKLWKKTNRDYEKLENLIDWLPLFENEIPSVSIARKEKNKVIFRNPQLVMEFLKENIRKAWRENEEKVRIEAFGNKMSSLYNIFIDPEFSEFLSKIEMDITVLQPNSSASNFRCEIEFEYKFAGKEFDEMDKEKAFIDYQTDLNGGFVKRTNDWKMFGRKFRQQYNSTFSFRHSNILPHLYLLKVGDALLTSPYHGQ